MMNRLQNILLLVLGFSASFSLKSYGVPIPINITQP